MHELPIERVSLKSGIDTINSGQHQRMLRLAHGTHSIVPGIPEELNAFLDCKN
jgi:hypothetical protein